MVTDGQKTTKLEEIRADLADNRVLLYMKGDKETPMCSFSAQVVNILNFLQVDFEIRDVLKDRDLREAIGSFASWPTIPLLFINGAFIGGCHTVTELYNSGELQNILTKKSG